MKYVKKDGVVKEVSDSLAGSYVSAGWQPAEKSEYERTAETSKTKNPRSYGVDSRDTN